MPWTLLADGIVAVLLVATLVYVRRFSVRLEAIRASRTDFEKLIGDLTRSTDQAASHLHQFRATAETVGRDLQARVERAQGLAAEFGRIGEDLKLLTNRAEGASDRLESTIGRSRSTAAPTPAIQSAKPAPIEEVVEDDDRQVAKLSALSGMR